MPTLEIPNFSKEFYCAASPVFLLFTGAMVALMMGVFKSLQKAKILFSTSVLTVVLALVAIFLNASNSSLAVNSYLSGSFVSGSATFFASTTILLLGLATLLIFWDHFTRIQFYRGEIQSLFLMILAGMLVMASADELISVFVGLELASIGTYALIGYIAPNRFSIEGAVKYFILGSVAAAILLMGFGFLYASTGSLAIYEILNGFSKLNDHAWYKLGLLFTIVGFCFKLALMPFHRWAPDAYESAPTPLTAFMATAMKVMILTTFFRLFAAAPSHIGTVAVPMMLFMAAISVIAGNTMALVQVSLKRMLAYSSIAHSGYMAIALCAAFEGGGQAAVSAVFLYLISYSIVTIGSFAIIAWFENEEISNITLDDMNDLYKKHPKASLSLAVFLLSLAGMPPAAGFVSKFLIFSAAISKGLTGIVVIAAIGSTIALYYYLRVIVRMFMSKSVQSFQLPQPKHSWSTQVIVGLCVLATLALGTVLPQQSIQFVKAMASELVKG